MFSIVEMPSIGSADVLGIRVFEFGEMSPGFDFKNARATINR
jgi:hypothetical protein